MQNIFLYPMFNPHQLKNEHPYVYELSQTLREHFRVINYETATSPGAIDAFVHVFKIDILMLNWIEDLGNKLRRTPIIPLFMLLCLLLRWRGKHLVWTHHNAVSHDGTNFWNKFLTKFIIRFSTEIIIHTKESLSLIPTRYHAKCSYFFHPIAPPPATPRSSLSPKWDLLIWSGIRRSKGVEIFLEKNAKTQGSPLKIRIVGKIRDTKLREEIMSFASQNVMIEDRFIEESEIPELHHCAKFIFFSYTGKSVLNSGVAAKSLSLGTPLIVPRKAAFNDMVQSGVAIGYDSFDEVYSLVSKSDKLIPSPETVAAFCAKHTWHNFGIHLRDLFSNPFRSESLEPSLPEVRR